MNNLASNAPLPENAVDPERLQALASYDILDTPREESFDRITRLIRNIFGVEVALVSMMDGHRQWFKSIDGFPAEDSDLRTSLCRAIIETSAPVVVPDATKDDRFSAHPHVSGDPHVRFYAGVPLTTPEGLTVGTVCAVDFKPREFSARDLAILSDLSRVAMEELEQRKLATVDSLTGLTSRKPFLEQADQAFSLASRHKHPLSCIYVDLDHFKTINDTFGHASGDRVLVAVSDACRDLLRRGDIMGRLGGEEFAIVLPHTDLAGALGVAEKLRAAVERASVEIKGKRPVVTASFGVAAMSEQTPDFPTLLDRADKATYAAKNAGRNQVVAFKSVEEAAKLEPGRRVLKAGSIIFNGRRSLIDCTIRSLSNSGAGIDVFTSVGIPDTFTLLIKSDRQELECRVLSRENKRLDVVFAKPLASIH